MSDETGITNLGPVPHGMSFREAIHQTVPARKYALDPHHESRRLTICETLREIYRETEKPEPDLDYVQFLVMSAGDFAKRMDARMKDLKR